MTLLLSLIYVKLISMTKINQKGLAPIVLIGGLLILGVITATGTYFALNMMQSEQKAANPAQNPTPAPITETIEQVKAANEESLLNIEGVQKVEVGEKDGKPCVIVFSFKETDELQNLENNGLGGYEVVVENTPQTN